ncbi:MAG: DUF3656 domain-containing protein, partial [Clostridia bacterium]|nr:DUF3656 domain-containing protein [Clostridia bacterium]
ISRRGVGAKNVGSGAQKGDGQWLEAASLGIGDVTDCGNGKYIFVTKTRVNVGWAVHLISTMEKSINDKKLAIELGVTALVGKPLSMTATAGDGIKVCVTGDVCERAKTAPVSADDIAKQASKTADSGFYVTHCNVYTDGIFVAKSMINSLRRDLLNSLAEAVISHAESKQQVTVCEQAINNTNDTLTCDFYDINIRFVHSDELNNTVSNVHIAVKNDEVVAICPEQYTVREIKRMVEILDVPYDRIALQLPVIANNMDLAIIGKILEELPEIRTLVSENIYGFAFADKGYKVIAGAGHNVLNAYAKRECEDLGMAGVLPAIESDKRRDLGEELPLMTFAYCPYKTVYGNECDKCSYKEGMTISRERKTYRVRRTRVANCYFGLYQ